MGEHEDFKPNPAAIAAAGKHFAAAAVFSALAKCKAAEEELEKGKQALEEPDGDA